MMYVSRYIQFDNRLQVYALDILDDGQNETLCFKSEAAARRAQRELLQNNGVYLPPKLDAHQDFQEGAACSPKC